MDGRDGSSQLPLVASRTMPFVTLLRQLLSSFTPLPGELAYKAAGLWLAVTI